MTALSKYAQRQYNDILARATKMFTSGQAPTWGAAVSRARIAQIGIMTKGIGRANARVIGAEINQQINQQRDAFTP